MVALRRFFQHHFNPLHVYCRMRDAGFRPRLTVRVCTVYERWLYRFLLP